MNKNEEMAKQNQVRINESEGKLANQVVQIEIFRSKVEVIEQELELHVWTIEWNKLVANDGYLESAPFYTSSDLYCLSLSMDYDEGIDYMDMGLHRCRDNNKIEEEEGGDPNFRRVRLQDICCM